MLNVKFDEKVTHSLDEMSRLRRFDGTPADFWPAFLAAAGGIAGAEKGVLILKDQKDGAWKKLSEWTHSGHADRTGLTFSRHLVEIGEKAAREGSVIQVLEQAAT